MAHVQERRQVKALQTILRFMAAGLESFGETCLISGALFFRCLAVVSVVFVTGRVFSFLRAPSAASLAQDVFVLRDGLFAPWVLRIFHISGLV